MLISSCSKKIGFCDIGNMGNEGAENGDFGKFSTFVCFYSWQVRFSEISSTSTMLLVLCSSVV